MRVSVSALIWIKRDAANLCRLRDIQSLLRARTRLWQPAMKINLAVTDSTFFGTHRAPSAFFKSSSGALFAQGGAEDSQNSFPISADKIPAPLELSRAARGPGPFRISITPERRGNNRDVSAERRRYAASVPETSGSYSRSDPREDARTPAGGDVAFPRNLNGRAA